MLSGNRNFEGRINQDVKANYLASPPLCVAYALAGRMDIDLTEEPLGEGSDGEPVYLRDLWPSSEEIKDVVGKAVESETFTRNYADVFKGDETWNEVEVPEGDRYTWPDSTYVRRPSYFDEMPEDPPGVEPIEGARVLAVLGDSVTTDHISPAGAIKKDSPAGQWLIEQGVEPGDFNSYGSRRGNQEVMIRGTFANIRLQNKLVDKRGGFTRRFPDGEETTIYEAAMAYADEDTPLVVLAGKEYGRDPRAIGRRRGRVARRPGGDRGELRAHPPLEPDRDGRAAAAVRRRRVGRVPGPDRRGDDHGRRPRGRRGEDRRGEGVR